jgi:hypothetical protein
MRAASAGALATVSVWALFASSLDRFKWLLVPVAVPAIPAHLACVALRLGGGPESLPYYTDPPMYILTFLVWWGIIEGVRTLWRWRQTRGQVRRR